MKIAWIEIQLNTQVMMVGDESCEVQAVGDVA